MLNGVLDAVRAEAPAAAARLAGPVSAVHIAGQRPARAAYALFPRGSRAPSVILKVATNRNGAQRLEAEHAALERIAGLSALGGRVPAPLGVFPFGDAVVLAQSAMPGVPMSVLLHRRPGLGPHPPRVTTRS